MMHPDRGFHVHPGACNQHGNNVPINACQSPLEYQNGHKNQSPLEYQNGQENTELLQDVNI